LLANLLSAGSEFGGGAALLFLEDRQGLLHMCQIKTAEGFEDVSDQRVAETVENLVAVFAGFNEVLAAQDGQVLRGIRLFDAKPFAKAADGLFAVAKDLQDAYAGRVRERLKDARFESPHRLGQRRRPPRSYMLNIEYGSRSHHEHFVAGGSGNAGT